MEQAPDDFQDLDAMDFLRASATRDKFGRPVIVIIARNFHPRLVALDRLTTYIVQRCEATVSAPYSLVWVHTRATYWQNCPSLLWLWKTYERLPSNFRSNLASVFVVHCDLNMWLLSMTLCPWLSGRLWRKMVWINRVEFLWDHVRKTPLPDFVGEHDAILEDQPLTDYGLTSHPEVVQAGLGQPL